MKNATLIRLGSLRSRVLKKFERAFGFAWDPVAGEKAEAANARQALRQGLRDAFARPPGTASPHDLELLQRIYELRSELFFRFVPGGREWVRTVRELALLAAQIGEQLREFQSLGAPAGAGQKTMLRLLSRWASVEAFLEQARRETEKGYTPSGEPFRKEFGRLGRRFKGIRSNFHRLRSSLRTNNPVYRGAQAAKIAQAGVLIDAFAEALERTIAMVPPMPVFDEKDPFRTYFERVIRDLAVIRTSVWVENGSPLRELGWVEFEVPPEFLVKPTSPDDARDAALCWVATFKKEFWDSLPSACRRHHREERPRGGQGNKNHVLEGITAAMLLSGLQSLSGKASAANLNRQFDAAVKATKSHLTRLGRSGVLSVDLSGKKIPTYEEVSLGLFGDLVPGRSDPCERPPLGPRYPMCHDSRRADPGEKPRGFAVPARLRVLEREPAARGSG